MLRADDALLECQIRYGQNQVSAIQCACGKSTAKNPCMHAWILAYWHHQQVVRQKKEAAKKLAPRKKFEFQDGIYQEKELTDFIQLSLRLNPGLNAWANLLLMQPYSPELAYENYMEALSGFDPQITKGSSSKFLKDFRHQLLLLDQIYDHSLSLYLRGNLEQAVHLLLASLVKSSQWFDTFADINQEKWVQQLVKMHQALHQILKSIKAPALRTSIFDLMMDRISEGPYYLIHREENLYHILYSFKEEKNKSSRTEELISAKIKETKTFFYKPLEGLVFLLNTHSPKIFIELIKRHHLFQEISSTYWLMLIGYFKEQHDFTRSRMILEFLVEKSPYRELAVASAGQILEFMIREGLSDELAKASRDFSIKFKESRFANVWYDSSAPDESELVKYIQEFKSAHVSDQHFILDFLAKSDAQELLLAELKERGDVDLLIQYDKVLSPDNRLSLLDTYVLLTQDYLNEYGGGQAYDYVQKIRTHLGNFRAKELLKTFTEKVEKLFPERISLVTHQKKTVNTLL
ncbi:MAG: hypothetical protein IPP06_12780 [Saprospiraceae bacterium]|nr:hypothetical protein [Candidatus Vicinibacter affinis]